MAAPAGSTIHRDARKRYRQVLAAKWPIGADFALKGPYDDPRIRDLLLNDLEADPYAYGSGYLKEAMLHRLPRWELDATARRRLAKVVLTAVDGATRREFRRVCIAARHADREILLPALRARLGSDDPARVWNAYCALRGMLGMTHPRGHRPSPIRLERMPEPWRAEMEKLDQTRRLHAEQRRPANLAGIRAMRERLETGDDSTVGCIT